MNTPKTCVLKVHIHCPGCEKKVYEALRKIDGVTSIAIDGEHGKVRVSGTNAIDQYTLLKALSKVGKKAEILWDSSSSLGMNQHKSNQEQLDQFSKTAGRLKQVEVTYSKTLKMTYEDDSSVKSCKSKTKHAAFDLPGSLVHRHLGGGCCDGHDDHHPSTRVIADDWDRKPVHHHVDSGRKTEFLTYDWHGQPEHHNMHDHGHDHDHNHLHGQGQDFGCTRALMPPTAGCNHCVSGGARSPPRPPRVQAYSRASAFSDENPHGCSLM